MTSINSEDDVIETFVKKQNLDCFRGNAENVLDRYYQCAKKFRFDGIVRITADCPLIDPFITDQVIQVFIDSGCDYVPNVFPRTFPDGLETEVIRFSSLEIAWKNAKLPSEKEHVTSYFKNIVHFLKYSTFFIQLFERTIIYLLNSRSIVLRTTLTYFMVQINSYIF